MKFLNLMTLSAAPGTNEFHNQSPVRGERKERRENVESQKGQF